MAVVLRLTRFGKKSQPFYRIVAAEKTAPRDGKYIEILGTFNPRSNPPTANFKEDRIKHWFTVGAKPSSVVRSLLKRTYPGFVEAKEDHQRKKIQERRKKRKERAAKSGKGKSEKKSAKKK